MRTGPDLSSGLLRQAQILEIFAEAQRRRMKRKQNLRVAIYGLPRPAHGPVLHLKVANG